MCRADMCWCNKAQTTCWFGRTKLFWQCPVWVGSDQGCCLGLLFIFWEQNARETSQNKPIGICFWISLFKGICHLDSYKNSLPLSNFSWLRRYWNGFFRKPSKKSMIKDQRVRPAEFDNARGLRMDSRKNYCAYGTKFISIVVGTKVRIDVLNG